MKITPELADPTSPTNPLALAPYFPWSAWHRSVPATWSHRELMLPRYASVLEVEGHIYVAKVYDTSALGDLEDVIETVGPLLHRHGVVVPVWQELPVKSSDWRGACCPEMTMNGETAPNTIALDLLTMPTELIYFAIHEAAHCTPAPGSDLGEPTELAHDEAFRRRMGHLLFDALEGPGIGLKESQKRWLRRNAHGDTYAPPIHPQEEWLWVEEPVAARR